MEFFLIYITHIRLQSIPNARHRGCCQAAAIGCIVVMLQAVAQLSHQDARESAAEHKNEGADDEFAQKQQHDQHEILAHSKEMNECSEISKCQAVLTTTSMQRDWNHEPQQPKNVSTTLNVPTVTNSESALSAAWSGSSVA